MKIIVFQHLDVEHPGVFREFWSDRSFQWQTVELDAGEPIPALDDFDVMAVMGGPMDVWQDKEFPWLKLEKAAIRRWVQDLGRPYLGVCLGHQLLASALQGEVGKMHRPEVGLVEVEITPSGCADPLFKGLPTSIETLQWHGAEIQRLPSGSEILARNAACPIQAFRWGRRAYGFQCHVEITSTTISDWEKIPEYKLSLETVLGTEGAQQFAQDATRKLPAFRNIAKQLDGNFWAAI